VVHNDNPFALVKFSLSLPRPTAAILLQSLFQVTIPPFPTAPLSNQFRFPPPKKGCPSPLPEWIFSEAKENLYPPFLKLPLAWLPVLRNEGVLFVGCFLTVFYPPPYRIFFFSFLGVDAHLFFMMWFAYPFHQVPLLSLDGPSQDLFLGPFFPFFWIPPRRWYEY